MELNITITIKVFFMRFMVKGVVMKIIKGVLTYTLLLLGGAAILAMLLVGCMFLFPNFGVFGWKVMFFSNKTASDVFTVNKVNAGQHYEIEVDAKYHDVLISQYSDNTEKINIRKIDDMFGLYDTSKSSEKYGSGINVDTSKFVSDRKLVIDTKEIEGAVLARNSYIHIYVPNNASYSFVIRTYNGDISIDGKATEAGVQPLQVKGLDITTVDGDFTWKNIRTKIVKSVYDAQAETATNEVVTEINTAEEGYNKNNYMRFVELNKLNATTQHGKFDFTLNYTDANNYIVTNMTGASALQTNWNINYEFDSTEANNSHVNNLRTAAVKDTSASEYYLNAVRGEFKFDNIIAKGLSVVGSDVLIEGKNIITFKNFNFNAPNGFFNIESLNSSLSTIATNNINVNLLKAQGELAITTTYGNIAIKNATKNTTLKSTHGNITVDNATSSLSAISEHGDIMVKQFSSKVYLKNTHGRITAAYNYNSAANNDLECEMINEEGSINAINIVLPTTLKTTAGGTINAIFKEMALNGYKHVIELASGNANIVVPNTQAFMFKGVGDIKGTVGSHAMQTQTDFVKVLNSSDAESALAKLEVKASTATATFATYNQAKGTNTAANSYERDYGIVLAA